MKTVKRIYNEKDIRFIIVDNSTVKVNASDMAEIFEKEVSDFTSLDSTKSFISTYLNFINEGLARESTPISKANIVSTINKSIYMDRDLALKFSSWLNPSFEIWFLKAIDSVKFSHYDAHFKALNSHQEEKLIYETLRRKAVQEQNELALQIIESQRRLESFKNDKSNALRRKTREAKHNLFNQED